MSSFEILGGLFERGVCQLFFGGGAWGGDKGDGVRLLEIQSVIYIVKGTGKIFWFPQPGFLTVLI